MGFPKVGVPSWSSRKQDDSIWGAILRSTYLRKLPNDQGVQAHLQIYILGYKRVLSRAVPYAISWYRYLDLLPIPFFRLRSGALLSSSQQLNCDQQLDWGVSPNRGNPTPTPKYNSPYFGDPQDGTPSFGKPKSL